MTLLCLLSTRLFLCWLRDVKRPLKPFYLL
nr:MAG TPA: hypothetical protein [Caudoviricetes sp.]